MAIPKLMSVPISMYSVSFLCLDSFKSPNLKTDLAVIKKPTASQWLNMMKIKTKIRSKMPIYLPASSRDSLSVVKASMFHLAKMVFMIIETGWVRNSKQTNSNKLLSVKIRSIGMLFSEKIK